MAQILIRGLDPKTVQALKQRAKLNGRSLQSEVKRIIERESGVGRFDETLKSLASLQATFKKQLPDSTALIREDRSR
ncbi:MAG: hypothetical protein K2X32_09980 [Phycisphaerales bacterium]|jgi:plasmid stability protein|nr:hypothetical protein [Phycisphaerales bacterium]